MDLVEQHYREWVVVPFYVVVSGYNEYAHEQEYACFRSAKCGDRKYSDKVPRRFIDCERGFLLELIFLGVPKIKALFVLHVCLRLWSMVLMWGLRILGDWSRLTSIFGLQRCVRHTARLT